MLEPIRLEFNLSDAGVGWLTGVSLALFYITVGIPISRLADRFNRRHRGGGDGAPVDDDANPGLTQNFWQFMLALIGVGSARPGGTPPST